MSSLRAMRMQNLTRMHKNILTRGEHDAMPSLQEVLISSGFLRHRDYVQVIAQRLRRARCRAARTRR
jgi:hypothetical protein